MSFKRTRIGYTPKQTNSMIFINSKQPRITQIA